MTIEMKTVYKLSDRLIKEPNYMILVQNLTLNKDRPNLGLAGRWGLFGSPEWWDSIKKGLIKSSFVSGEIISVYEQGQDNIGRVNAFTLKLKNGDLWNESIYTLNDFDQSLFKVNHVVDILYAHDQRKPNESGVVDYSNTVIEMRVSERKICGGFFKRFFSDSKNARV